MVATWFGCGYSPLAPGTVGSAAAIAIAWAAHHWLGWGRWHFVALALVLTPVSVWAASRVCDASGKEDPQTVVVDEVLGQWLTLAGAAALTPPAWILAFGLFRLFDITKPWPIRQLEHLPKGQGIIADDLGAGAYGALVLCAAGWFNLY
ncbi:MAG: phosphatidylglycerophosphatase A [Acidobacteria bacterium]|nr:phosphatidylglycerophosphatase A [Acidobacteriota bacterium]